MDWLGLLIIAWRPLVINVVRVPFRPHLKFLISNNLMDV